MTACSPDTAGVMIRPPVLFGGALLLGVVLETLWPVGQGLLAAGWVQIATGTALVVFGAAIAASAIGRFQRAGTNIPTTMPTLALVTTGAYARSRNPIYIGLILFYTGLAVALNAWWSMILLPAALGVLRYGVIAREEAYLAAKFPDRYADYCARVRRWL